MNTITSRHTPADLSSVPRTPGCYIFRNRHGQIIYVGKSKLLYNRVRQYFRLTEQEDYNKYAELAREVADIETIITDTETNALILECKLIKEHKPKYNSQMKRNSDYHYICVDTERTFPVISVTGEVKNGGCRCFGGFHDRYDAENTVALINSIWKTPVCGKESTKACLNFQIGKCLAPCAGMIDADEYRAKISEIIKCLNGGGKGTLKRLNREMQEAANALDFEKAAVLREKVTGLERLMKKQKRLYTDLRGKDVFLFLRAYNEPRFSLFFIRDGAVVNRADFENLDEPDDGEFLKLIDGEPLPDGGELLTACVLAISASKLFIPVSVSARSAERLKKLRSGFKEFL